jgi:Endonuclease-reverse transcriptase
MTRLAELISRAGKNTVLIGDFNLPGVDWSNGLCRSNERQVVEAVNEKLMVQMVDFATHTEGNILDLVVTNMPERILDVREEGRLGKSDHSILVVEISVGKVPEKKEDTRLDWGRADWKKMEDMLDDRRWLNKIRVADTEQAWKIFTEKINEVTEAGVPVRRRRNVNRPPWMNQEMHQEEKEDVGQGQG